MLIPLYIHFDWGGKEWLPAMPILPPSLLANFRILDEKKEKVCFCFLLPTPP